MDKQQMKPRFYLWQLRPQEGRVRQKPHQVGACSGPVSPAMENLPLLTLPKHAWASTP